MRPLRGEAGLVSDADYLRGLSQTLGIAETPLYFLVTGIPSPAEMLTEVVMVVVLILIPRGLKSAHIVCQGQASHPTLQKENKVMFYRVWKTSSTETQRT
jgi:hypothetical protein